MSQELHRLLDLPKRSARPEFDMSGWASEFRRKFVEAIKPVNEHLRTTAVCASADDHCQFESQRDNLYAAFRKVISQTEGGSGLERDVERVIAAVDLLASKVRSAARQGEGLHARWSKATDELDDLSVKVLAIESAEHEDAATLGERLDEIRSCIAAREFSVALPSLEKLSRKVDRIVAEEAPPSSVGGGEEESALPAATPTFAFPADQEEAKPGNPNVAPHEIDAAPKDSTGIDDVKVDIWDPEGDVRIAVVKRLAERTLKIIKKRLKSSSVQKRLEKKLSKVGVRTKIKVKGQPPIAVNRPDLHKRLDAEEDFVMDLAAAVVDATLKKLWWDSRKISLYEYSNAEKIVRAVIREDFRRERQDLAKTEGGPGREDKIKRARQWIREEIARHKKIIADLEAKIAETRAEISRLEETDARTEAEQQGGEPPHPDYPKLEEAKQRLNKLKDDLVVPRWYVDKELPRLDKELEAAIKNAPKGKSLWDVLRDNF